ncbi:MAG: class I mannose-6-phosphate isomerase [Phycisphaerae bacterium]|nr:class I mannose-6-phosphate isomerase [Phycisphaerae bacterium]
MQYSPLKFTPIFKERIWGSDRLKSLYNKNLPTNNIGESWEMADLPEDKTIVSAGQFKGMNLREVLETHGLAMGFTDEQIASPFGLFVKLLDADDDLSVQVHPDADACKLFPGSALKTECWYVLHATDDGCIYKGLKPGTTRDDMAKAIENGTVEDLMLRHSVKKGDFHHLPAGTIHALGAGVVIAEVQTPSDTTYRVFDWNRTDAAGNSRQLHINEALESIHFQHKAENADFDRSYAQSLKKIASQIGTAKPLVDCEFFSVNHVTARQNNNFTCNHPFVMIVISGNGAIGNTEEKLNYAPGDTILVPKTDNGLFKVETRTEMLFCCLGPSKP